MQNFREESKTKRRRDIKNMVITKDLSGKAGFQNEIDSVEKATWK